MLEVISSGWHVALMMGHCLRVVLRRHLHLCPVRSEDTQQLSRVGVIRFHLQGGWERDDARFGREYVRDM